MDRVRWLNDYSRNLLESRLDAINLDLSYKSLGSNYKNERFLEDEAFTVQHFMTANKLKIFSLLKSGAVIDYRKEFIFRKTVRFFDIRRSRGEFEERINYLIASRESFLREIRSGFKKEFEFNTPLAENIHSGWGFRIDYNCAQLLDAIEIRLV